MTPEPQYLADGVYVCPWPEGNGILLRLGSHIEEDAEATIYMEPEVIRALLFYIYRNYPQYQQ